MRPGSRLAGLAFLLAAAGLGLVPCPAAAQQTFTGATEVVVVEVPVQVVKDGEPVRGLTAADFEVFDGRKKVPITGYEVLDLAAPVAEGTAAAVQVPASARRHFLVLFDLTFSEPKALSNARQAAQDVVKTLHPTDLVAVATYSSLQGPQLVLGFTPDRQQIAAAIETLGLPKMFDRAGDPLRLVLMDAANTIAQGQQVSAATGGAAGAEVRAARDAEVLDTLKSFSIVSARAEKTIQQQIVRSLTKSFADLARLMGEVEGRKYVVFLSEGYDSSLITGSGSTTAGGTGGNDLSNLIDSAGSTEQALEPTGGAGSDDRYGDTSTQNAVEKMLEEFRRADCAIQAVNIGGLRAGGEAGGFQRADGRESLLNMAKSTGGEFYENFNDLSAAMGQMLRRTGVTYVLSFQPDNLKQDGAFHKLRVELKGKGGRVVHRPGFYAPRPYKDQPPLQRLLETANTVMGEESGSIGAAVLAAPFAAGGERAYVPVVIEIDGASLLAGKQEPKLPMEVYVYAIDQNGSVQDFLTQSFGVDLTKAEAAVRQSGVKFFGHLDLPKGSYTLRTLVRNGTTGASSLRVTDLEVPAFASGEAALLPALFPEPPGRWVMVRETLAAGTPQAPYPFMLKEQPYIPASRPVLAPGQPAAVVLQGYNLGAGDLKAEAVVLAADGKEMPGGALKLSSKEGGGGGATRVAATYQPPSLQPGDYVLRVTLTDGAGKVQTSLAPFAVGGAAGSRGSR
jgi:VWFA-related protein